MSIDGKVRQDEAAWQVHKKTQETAASQARGEAINMAGGER
jgi:hypothetical protein